MLWRRDNGVWPWNLDKSVLRRHCFDVIWLQITSVVTIGVGRVPGAFRLGGSVDSPRAVLISSRDLPCATIGFILSHLSSMKASFVLTSFLVNRSPWPET